MNFSFLSQFDWFEIWSNCNVETSSSRQNRINSIFWMTLCLSLFYHYFYKILKPHLKAAKLGYHKWNLTAHYVFNCCFYLAALVFLWIYKQYFLVDSISFKQNGQNYYRSYENRLFFTSNNRCSIFASINFILISFYLIDLIYDLNEGSISEAISKLLACGLVICFDVYRLEYFSVMYNTVLVLIYLFTDGVRLICWHIPEESDLTFRVCVTLKLLLWSFVFLNVFPFYFLIPTFYGRKLLIWLNVNLLTWYGFCIWNSPILQYMYHQIYHTKVNSNDCLGGTSVSRCILMKESRELCHFYQIQYALSEIQSNSSLQSNPSLKTYQTIKCMIALKRKLKRIRENKDLSI